MPAESHGTRIWRTLIQLMRDLGRKPSEVEGAHAIDCYLEANAVALKKVRKQSEDPKPRARDLIFDALAKIDGQDLAQLTKQGAHRIAGAKKQILAVMPGASTSLVVEEIERRAAAYRRKHPSRELTAMALVTWWAELGGGPMTKAAVADIYVEPACDWRATFCEVLRVERTARLDEIAWSDISPEFRRQVLDHLARKVVPISNGDGWVREA